jgi:hypothetical protein
MAKEVFHVLYGQKTAGLGLDGVVKEYTKAQAEALDPRLKEISVLKGPVTQANYVEVEAESAEQAAIFVKKVLAGGGGQQTTNFITVKTTAFTETNPT